MGIVDLRDFVNFLDVFEQANAAPASVPEPSAMILAMLALAGIATHRRRR